MIRRLNGRHVWLPVAACLTLLAFAMPASAQTGMVKGTVKDAKGQPVEGATVRIENTSGNANHIEQKTNKKGEFVQVGLQLGSYKITASKEGVGGEVLEVRVRMGNTGNLEFVLGGGGAAPPSKEELAKSTALTKVFEEGVAASKAGNNDEAIGKFSAALELNPKCSDCYYNLGYAYAQKKEYDKAIDEYKKAIDARPTYAEAYNGLANVYNAQRKFDDAAAASTKANELSAGAPGAAAGGGNADAMFNQGVILWNSGKVAEAKKAFEGAIAANPNHAESHYQLGMALVNEGNLPGAATEFETYIKLAPTGPNAATAKGMLATLKK